MLGAPDLLLVHSNTQNGASSARHYRLYTLKAALESTTAHGLFDSSIVLVVLCSVYSLLWFFLRK